MKTDQGYDILLTRANPYLGCDPELFFEREGEVIGGEKVLGDKGSISTDPRNSYEYPHKGIVLDGVQVEINPRPSTCRESLAEEMQVHLRNLKNHLLSMKGVKASFRSVVTMKQEELDSLSERSRILGCAPSLNIYDKEAGVKVNPSTYLTRSAGGHIHLGGFGSLHLMRDEIRSKLIPLLDVLVGNTCVLIDRDPEAGERRKVYGRAGEHRLPKHGVEYRTLSNFWLRNYVLFAFVMGMSRMAYSAWYYSELRDVVTQKYDPNLGKNLPPTFGKEFPSHYFDFASSLLSKIKMDRVQEAINTNNLEMAKENFEGVKEWIREFIQDSQNVNFSLEPQNLDTFDLFTKKIEEEGLDYWFPQEPLDHWCGKERFRACGWETFITGLKLSEDVKKMAGKIKDVVETPLLYPEVLSSYTPGTTTTTPISVTF